jgi:hypothetical protein
VRELGVSITYREYHRWHDPNDQNQKSKLHPIDANRTNLSNTRVEYCFFSPADCAKKKKPYVLINKIQATIPRHESADFLAILDQLNTHAFTNGRVWLFGLNTAERRSKQKKRRFFVSQKKRPTGRTRATKLTLARQRYPLREMRPGKDWPSPNHHSACGCSFCRSNVAFVASHATFVLP